MIIYRVFQALARWLWPVVGGRLNVEGLQNVPAAGPALLIGNHQSYLDPIMVQAVVPRIVHGMAKSTQFGAPVLGWLLAQHLAAFPVRRFQVDPQAVRTALRLVEKGRLVAIYIEGERSWDGRLQEPRLGTLRLLLKAGVPVVPMAITGAYDAWPRWDRRIRRADITIRFGPPMHFPQLDDRRDREAILPEVKQRLMGVIQELMSAGRPAGVGALTAAGPDDEADETRARADPEGGGRGSVVDNGAVLHTHPARRFT